MSENVLLLCLSKVDFSHGLTKYKYDGLDEPIVGYMTNEAPAKVVLSIVDHLDRIVAICSEDVLNENIPLMGTSEEEDKISKYITGDSEFPINDMDQFEKYPELKYTHFDYYKAVIRKYATEKGKEPPKFSSINIANNPAEYEIAEVAVKAADLIMRAPMSDQNNEGQSDCEEQLNAVEQKKDIHLYIDYNGGQRYIASMLLNTANLIEQKGANIEKVFTMNFLNRDNDGCVAVENFIGVLQSSRLVSGIKEYDDYGRCKELQKYFGDYEDKDIKKILGKMEKLSHYFQMCDTDHIFGTEKKELKRLLDDYVKKDDMELEKRGARSILFKYVAEDILEGYQPLFDDDLLDIIDWCRNKEYIQQAVTFYTERMPVYFWDKGIYYPTVEEESGYRRINEACTLIKEYQNQNLNGEARQGLTELGYLNSNDENKSRDLTNDDLEYLKKEYLNCEWKYAWLVKYLAYGGIDENVDRLEWMGNANLRHNLVKYQRERGHKNFWDEQRVRSEYVPDRSSQNYDEQKSKLYKILEEYSNIKKQRNNINHANDNSSQSQRWSYEVLCNNLKNYVKNIREFMGVDNNMS